MPGFAEMERLAGGSGTGRVEIEDLRATLLQLEATLSSRRRSFSRRMLKPKPWRGIGPPPVSRRARRKDVLNLLPSS